METPVTGLLVSVIWFLAKQRKNKQHYHQIVGFFMCVRVCVCADFNFVLFLKYTFLAHLCVSHYMYQLNHHMRRQRMPEYAA